jgi:7-carboxy-7-deazaguanine synthase
MQITEIYRSIQGESSFTGLPCTFVRLTACNLRCSWCDSEYTFTGGKKMSLAEVEGAVVSLSPAGLIEFTGGEPMIQAREVIPLMERLLALGYTLLLETSGERPLDGVPQSVHKIVDVKCPGSGESGKFRLSNLQILTPADELKFVLADRKDYEFALDFIRRHKLDARFGNLIFSPAFCKTPTSQRDTSNCLLSPQQLAEWILEDKMNVRLGLQIHKFIWEPATKGV